MGALAFLHDQALVQFNHRIWAYGLLIGGTIYAVQAWRWRLAEGLGAVGLRRGGRAVAAGRCWAIVTLIHAVPLWLGALHQAGAVAGAGGGDGEPVAGAAVAGAAVHVRTALQGPVIAKVSPG